MADLEDLELIANEDEETEMASWNHGVIQGQLYLAFKTDVQGYTPNLEVSLEVSKFDLSSFSLGKKEKLRPDVCLYPAHRRGLSRPKDIVRMSEMPLLAVEILSPRQGLLDLKEKFEVYFFLGIKSCWMVLPEIEEIAVYKSIEEYQPFNRRRGDSVVVDEVLNIKIPLDKIFE